MKFGQAEHGSALVEFALVLPLMLLIVTGAVNYSLRIQQAMQVTEAANAGVAFGVIPGNQANLSGMVTAAKNAASGVPSMTATATRLWTCTPGGTAVTSSTTCAGYGTPIQYVQVTTSANLPAFFAWTGVSSALTSSQTATFRVPWTP